MHGKKITFRTLFILLPLFAVALSGCMDEGNKPNLVYVNEEYGFGLNPPEGWIVNEQTYDPVKFFCPDQNDYQVHIVINRPVTLNLTLEDIADDLLGRYEESYFKNFSLISRTPKTINNMNAYELVYTEGKEPNMLQHKQILYQKDEIVFTLTYNSLVRTYDTYIAVVDQCIDSFMILSS